MQNLADNYLKEIEQEYPSLRIKFCDKNFATYVGIIAFAANYNDCGLIDDEFEVEIVFPLTNTDDVPKAKETGGRIPCNPDFHVNDDGTMCLGAPFEIRRKHKQDLSLRAFINRLLIPFLYAFSFQEKHGHMPFGELSHGRKGVVEYYREFFWTDSDLSVLELLKIIVEDNYRGHISCPCESGKRLRNCHGPQIREIKEQQSREQFFSDFIDCLRVYMDSGKKPPRQLVTKRLRNYWNKMFSDIER
jgi:hypothetical protein